MRVVLSKVHHEFNYIKKLNLNLIFSAFTCMYFMCFASYNSTSQLILLQNPDLTPEPVNLNTVSNGSEL